MAPPIPAAPAAIPTVARRKRLREKAIQRTPNRDLNANHKVASTVTLSRHDGVSTPNSPVCMFLDGSAILIPRSRSGLSTRDTGRELEGTQEVPIPTRSGDPGPCLCIMARCMGYGLRRVLVDRPG